MKEFEKILVVGLGYRTGLAVSNFFAARGVRVTTSDTKSSAELADVLANLDPGVRLLLGEQKPDILDEGFDALVLSPGVPAGISLVTEAYRRNIPVMAEVELAFRFMEGVMVAITGTDGKSTTTALTGHIFKELGIDTLIGGNIGIPLISFVEKTTVDSVTVAELSSFQLETITSFRPDVAVMLNVTPDHLDRYAGMEEYFKAKMRIAMNQKEDDYFVYNLDDSMACRAARQVNAAALSFSIENNSADIYWGEGSVFLKEEGRHILDTDQLKIMGMHNVHNTMAAVLAVRLIMKKKGIVPDYDSIARAAYSFPGLHHRLEKLGVYQDREFINDSKATTVNAVLTALRSLGGKGVLILGGRTKGDDYSRLAAGMNGTVRSLIVIGESKEYFSKLLKKYGPIPADSLDDAVVKAMRASREGDVILLSPACASFDMFKNYEERGEEFRKSFHRLASGALSWT